MKRLSETKIFMIMQACIINIYIIYVWYLIIPFLINKYFSIYYEFGNYILYKKMFQEWFYLSS
jgi:hypothetical protein